MLTDGKPGIDYTRVANGFQFDTPRLRSQYLGKTTREKPRFLEEHRGQFQRVEDVLRESAQSPDGIGAARTELTVPAPVNGNVPSGSTHTKLPPGAEAATSETNESETDTTPLEETGRKQGRGGRQRKKRRLSAKALKARRKLMLAVLEYLSESPVLSAAARKAGVHRKKLEYWIKRSKAGDDGYDFECEGLMWRFHELVDFAIAEANDKVDEVALKLAMGELYKNGDGREVPGLYVRRPDWKMMRFLLETKFPEKYGKHPKVDIPRQGGVVLIGAPKKPRRTVAPASVKARRWKALSRRVRQTKD
jgi:hypothetical protein